MLRERHLEFAAAAAPPLFDEGRALGSDPPRRGRPVERAFRLAAIVQSELLHRAVEVRLDRTYREHQTVGDLGSAAALGGELRDLYTPAHRAVTPWS
jgi:hypothetical protein